MQKLSVQSAASYWFAVSCLNVSSIGFRDDTAVQVLSPLMIRACQSFSELARLVIDASIIGWHHAIPAPAGTDAFGRKIFWNPAGTLASEPMSSLSGAHYEADYP